MQNPSSGKFAIFRMEPVFGESFMPLGCIILEGGGNAKSRAWKAFGQWGQHDPQSVPKPITPEHTLCAVRKIVIFVQGGDTLSKKVMEDLSSEERRSVVDQISSIVLSLLKRECVSAQCQMPSEQVRRLAERALQKGLECSRRATHKWLCQALKGGAGPAHKWCGKEDAPRAPAGHQRQGKETSRQTRNVLRNCTLTSGNVSVEAKMPSVSSKK